jgi:hypothetical protein
MSRGDIVDEMGLIGACGRGRIAGERIRSARAAVRVAAYRGGGDDEREALFAMIGENLRLYRAGKPLKRVVAF